MYPEQRVREGQSPQQSHMDSGKNERHGHTVEFQEELSGGGGVFFFSNLKGAKRLRTVWGGTWTKRLLRSISLQPSSQRLVGVG